MILDYEYFQLESMDVFNFFAQIYLKKKKKSDFVKTCPIVKFTMCL